MRPARAQWGGEHFRTPLEPLQRFWNTQSSIGHFHGHSVDRYLLRDRDRHRSWPSETCSIPEYPMDLEPPTPADTKFPWLPFARAGEGEARFEAVLDDLNRRFRGGAVARSRRRSTLRLSGMDREDTTDYTAELNAEKPDETLNKSHRFGDPAQNQLRDKDSLRRMESWLARDAPAGDDGAPAADRDRRGNVWDARMRTWIDDHKERIRLVDAETEKKKEKKAKYTRRSNYGRLVNMDGDSVMSSYSGGQVSMTSDTTKLPPAMAGEKRRTMAYIGT